jgi:hypothetical protein
VQQQDDRAAHGDGGRRVADDEVRPDGVHDERRDLRGDARVLLAAAHLGDVAHDEHRGKRQRPGRHQPGPQVRRRQRRDRTEQRDQRERAHARDARVRALALEPHEQPQRQRDPEFHESVADVHPSPDRILHDRGLSWVNLGRAQTVCPWRTHPERSEGSPPFERGRSFAALRMTRLQRMRRCGRSRDG